MERSLGGKGCGVGSVSVPDKVVSAQACQSAEECQYPKKEVSASTLDKTDNPGDRGRVNPAPVLLKLRWTGVYDNRDSNRGRIARVRIPVI